MNHINFIMAYEGGELESEEELVDGFQAMTGDGGPLGELVAPAKG